MMVIRVGVMVVAVVIGHRVSNRRAANAANHRAHRAANESAAYRARDASRHCAAFVGEGRGRSDADQCSGRRA